MAGIGMGAAVVMCVLAGAVTSSASPDREAILTTLTGFVADDPKVRAIHVANAGKTEHPIFVDPLRNALTDSSATVKAAAAQSLGDFGVPRTSGDLSKIISSLTLAAYDRNPNVAKAALFALGRFPFPDARKRLRRLAFDRVLPVSVRIAAREALTPKNPKEAEKRMRDWLRMSQGEDRAWQGAATLERTEPTGEVRWGVTDKSLLRIARDFLDPDSGMSTETIRELSAWPETSRTFPFLRYALKKAKPKGRRVAATSLARAGDKRGQQTLMSVLGDADEIVRKIAINGVGQLDDRESVVRLTRALRKEPVDTLRQQLRSLLTTKRKVDVLHGLDAWPHKVPEKVRVDGIYLVGTSSTPTAANLLVRFLENSHSNRSAQPALQKLSTVGTSTAVPPLLAALRRSRPRGTARYNLLFALRGRKHPEILSTLFRALDAGEGDRNLMACIADHDAQETRVPLLQRLGSRHASTRKFVLEGLRGTPGPDVVEALDKLISKHPRTTEAYRQLYQQDPELSLPTRLKLLGGIEYSAQHETLLSSLNLEPHPDVSEPVLFAVQNNPNLSHAAVPILEAQAPADAISSLGLLAQNDALPVDLRLRAIRGLESRGIDLARAPLKDLARNETTAIKMAARNALHRLEPAIYPAWDPYGRIPLIVESSALGATLMLVAADLAEAELSSAFTGGVGAVLGGASSFLLTTNEELTLADASYFGTLGLWGTLGGWGLGGALELSKKDTQWATLAGETLGIAAGALTLSISDWSLEDAALANVSALQAAAGGAAAASLFLSPAENKADRVLKIGMLSGAVATIPMAFTARKIRLATDAGLLSTTIGHGAFLGMFAPSIKDGEFDAKRAFAGAALGQAVGYYAGSIWAQYADVPAENLGYSILGALAGASTFAGLGLVFDEISDPTTYALLQGGGAAGALAFGIFGPKLEFRENDAILVALSTLGGAFAGSSLSVRLEEKTFDEPSFPGGVMVGAGLGLTAGLVTSQLLDVTDRQLFRTLVGTGLFATAGFGLSRIFTDLTVRERSRFTSVATATGLALSAPLAHRMKLGGTEIVYGSMTMLTGAAIGSLSAIYTLDEGEDATGGQYAAGATFGAATGLIAGLTASQFLDLRAKDTLTSGFAGIAGGMLGGGLGLLTPSFDRKTTVALTQGLSLLGLTGATTLGNLARKKKKKRPSQRRSLAAQTLGFMVHGTLHGSLIPYTWRTDRPAGSEVGGGMLFGAGLGATIALASYKLLPRPAPIDLLEASLLSPMAFGLGAGIGGLIDDRRAAMGVVHGLGISAYVAGMLVAPVTEWTGRDMATIGLGSVAGGWLGAWLPSLFDVSERTPYGLLAGASLGAIGGAVLSQTSARDRDTEATAGLIVGSAAGAGLGLMIDPNADTRTELLLELGGLAGATAGLLIAPFTNYESKDVGLLTLGTALGAAQGAWATRLLRDPSSENYGGGVLLGASLGLSTALATSQFLELAPADALEIGLFSASAQAIGGGLAIGIDDPRTGAAVALATGIAGFATATYFAPRTNYLRDDAGLVSIMTIAGALYGLASPELGSSGPTTRARGAAALTGAGVGSVVGAALSQFHPLSLGDQAESLLWGLTGHALGGGASLLFDIDGTPGAALATGAGLVALSAGLGLSPLTNYDTNDGTLVGLTSALGAWHGMVLPLLIEGADGNRADALGGGALLGLGTGLAVGALTSQFVDIDYGDQVKGGLTWLSASAVGGGLGLLLDLDTRGTTLMVEVAGIAGLVAGLTLADDLEFESGDKSLVAFGTLLGAGVGLTLPTLIEGDGDASAVRRGGGTLLGAGLGALGASTLAQFTEFQTQDVVETMLFTSLSGITGLGLGLAIPDSSAQARLSLMNGFAAAGLATGLLAAPRTDYSEHALVNLGFATTLGGLMGGLAPGLWNESLSSLPAEQVGGGILLGTGLGLGAGALVDQWIQPTRRTRSHIALGAGIGALSGAGLGLGLSDDDRVAVGLLEGLAVAGAVGIGTTARNFDFDAGDLARGTAYAGYLTWHSMGLTLLLDGTNRQAAGVAMSTVGLGSLLGIYISPHLNLDLADILMLLTGNMWGTWIGGWGGAVLRDNLDRNFEGREVTGSTLLATVLGSDVGLAISSLVVAGLFDVKPTRFAVINLSGLGGMMLGMLGASAAKDDPLRAGNVIGSLAGLVLGAVVTSFFDWDSGATWDDLLSGGSPKPENQAQRKHETAGLKLIDVEMWTPSAQVQPGPEGEARYMFGVTGTFH